jgi:putative ubiquitin-RnfH superfamily antitoxin RatB of RatAB toxin-antitoxin module
VPAIEVVYALPDRQALIELRVEEGCTVFEAARRAGLEARFPGLDLSQATLGIFGRVVEDPSQATVQEGDRVEIYRPLLIDPKEARRRRAGVKRS